MGSLSFSEIVVIVLVILIVFGPNRLPDLARKAGEFMNKVRNASSSMTDALGVDYEETVEPFLSAKRDFDSIKSDFSKTMTTFGEAATISSDAAAADAPEQQATDAAVEDEPVVPTQDQDVTDDVPEAEIANEADSPDDSTAAT